MTGEEERACWERAVVEVEPEADDAPAEGARAAVTGGNSLWGTPTASEVPPDGESRLPGWTESDSTRDPETPAHPHGSSIRSRPWGPVPGLREPTGWRRGIRSVTRKG